jgi:hypothetical protein
MKPVSPVAFEIAQRFGIREIIFAKDQPQYIALPALKFPDGLVVTRWSLSLRERLKVLCGGSVYLGLLTFNNPLQPIRISTSVEEVCGLAPKDK